MSGQERMTPKNGLFWIFGILQALILGFIIFILLGASAIGKDSRITLSVLFPVFTLVVEYMIYSKE
ncbi:MAG: hypothetical protein ABH879_03200 [archaeon]